MLKNFADAKKYVNKIDKGLIKDPFINGDVTDALKILAKVKDEDRFKIVVDLMCSSILNKKNLKLFKKEPLALVESFCEVIDNPIKANYAMYQTYRGLKVKRPPTGKTQRFFQSIYGSHFFKKK
jgi:hypothetical protein